MCLKQSNIILFYSYVPTYKYHLAVSTLENKLYLAEPQMRRIYELEIPLNGSNHTQVDILAGTGRPCLLVDADGCGDNGPASNARLYSPKGTTESMPNRFTLWVTLAAKIEANQIICISMCPPIDSFHNTIDLCIRKTGSMLAESWTLLSHQ